MLRVLLGFSFAALTVASVALAQIRRHLRAL